MSTPKHTPTSEDYNDSILFGPRVEVNKLLDYLKTHNDTECVFFEKNTFGTKELWKLDNIIRRDKRLRSMMEALKVDHAVPIQRYCWPKMHHSMFPVLCVSPRGSGKTYAHLIYIVSDLIRRNVTDEVDLETENLDDLRSYPKCLIISSTHDQADYLVRKIDEMKQQAYASIESDPKSIRKMMPIARSVSVDQPEDKLCLRCHESSILIGTPPALIKSLELRAIRFSSAEHVIFDDVDLCLQLHNYRIQELMSAYLSEVGLLESRARSKVAQVRISMFSRKWTELVKKFINNMFPQRIVIFGSIAEASVFLNARFEMEFYQDPVDKIDRLTKLVSFITETNHEKANGAKEKFAIVCSNDLEASELGDKLGRRIPDLPIRLVDAKELGQRSYSSSNGRSKREPILILSDAAIDHEVELTASRNQLSDITHLIHFSLPNDMLVFDQRFRLMHKHIQNERCGLLTTIFLGPKTSSSQSEQLYDLVSRSSSTLRGTKSALRDYIDERASYLCWRWAAIGLCRFAKLSREDRFGSYCPDRHSLMRDKQASNRWPHDGQLKMTLTHVVSPSEYYFWFEAHRDISNINWTKFPLSGRDYMKKLQVQLDKFRDAAPRSLPISKIRKGGIYGVYFHQEARVDRVLLLDEPKHEIERNEDESHISNSLARINPQLEYSKLLPVKKIDYGSRVEVYVKNLFELPESLESIEPQAHRAFHIGYKPISNEPNWHYKTKRQFFEKVTQQNICSVTAWLRLNKDNCFWMDNMVVSRELANIDSTDIISIQPHKELCRDGLAETTTGEPEYLGPSIRLLTLGKWNSQKLNQCANYAFLRRDKPILDLFLLNVGRDQRFENIVVRQVEFNKRLIDLEDSLLEDYVGRKLATLQHLDIDVYCLARLDLGSINQMGEKVYAINRVRIVSELIDQNEDRDLNVVIDEDERKLARYRVVCLDHGDRQIVARSDLFEATPYHLRQLPFQAIACKLANISPTINNDESLRLRASNLMIDISRHSNNDYKVLKGRIVNPQAKGDKLELYLYAAKDESCPVRLHYPMSQLFLEEGIKLHETSNPEYEQAISTEVTSEEDLDLPDTDLRRMIIFASIESLMRELIGDELNSSRADAD